MTPSFDPKRLENARHVCPVSGVRFTPSKPVDRGRGSLGHVEFLIHHQFLVRAYLRRSDTGRHYIEYPDRRSKSGRKWPYVQPITAEVGEAVDLQVLHALRPV